MADKQLGVGFAIFGVCWLAVQGLTMYWVGSAVEEEFGPGGPWGVLAFFGTGVVMVLAFYVITALVFGRRRPPDAERPDGPS